MKKVLFVAKVVRSHIATFHIPYLKAFKEWGWETAVAAHNDYENPAECVIPYCDTYYDVPFERFPFSPSNMTALRQLKKIIDLGAYDIIHCHTPVSAMIARLAAIGARKKGTQVIYTAHGLHFFKGAPLVNWLVYFPVEYILARFTDVLITINREDYERAQRFPAKKVCYVPGVGIDTRRFAVSEDERKRKRDAIRKELGISSENVMLLSVGEVNQNKNHRIVIEALKKLGDQNVHYVICGSGSMKHELLALAKECGVDGRVHLTDYRSDVADFYLAADIFAFPSLREGLPVAVMEAMASDLPVICSNTRGMMDLIDHDQEGYLAEPTAEAFVCGIKRLMKEPELRSRYAKAARAKVEQFSLDRVVRQMESIYAGVINEPNEHDSVA